MTTTQESGRHVTAEHIRADGEAMERAGFRLMYECPLAATDEERRARHALWDGWAWACGALSIDFNRLLSPGRNPSDYSCNPPGPGRMT